MKKIILQNQKYPFLTNKLPILVLVFIFVIIFILEVVFFLPSPRGDGLWFLKLSFNICRDNVFAATQPSVFTNNAEALNWTSHGWFNQYILAKFNYACSIRGIFLFNFILKIISSFLIYLILKDKRINLIYIYLIILLTLVVQLKLQYRPENFTICLYLLLIYFFFKSKYLATGFFFGAIFFTQPTIFFFITLFGLIFYFKKLFKNYFQISIGIVISFFLITYIYPYSLLDYIIGVWGHRVSLEGPQTLLEGGLTSHYFQNFKTYYITPHYLPFFGFLFLFLYLLLCINKKIFILTLPAILFFGPNFPFANYVLIGLTPSLIILLISFDQNRFNLKYLHYLFTLVLIVSTLGLSQYLLRNILSAKIYSAELEKTKTFLLKNRDKIKIYPGFSFIIDSNFRFVSLGNKEINTDDLNLEIYSISGRINPCLKNTNYENKSQGMSLFSKKVFNSNTGYGIWICN